MEGKEEAIVETEDIFKVCKGCRTSTKEESRRVCLIPTPILSMTQQCPCINCLIKGMCMSGCEEYREYGQVLARRVHNE